MHVDVNPSRHLSARSFRRIISVLAYGMVVVFVVLGIRVLFYREVELDGLEAERRIAVLTGLSPEMLRGSEAKCHAISRLLRGGPIYLRFNGDEQTAGELKARRVLTGPVVKTLQVSECSPSWWQSAANQPPDYFDHYHGHMDVWISKRDYVCFIKVSGG